MDYTSLSNEELLETIKQIPDWDRYPWPEVFYEKYNLPKPKARDSSVAEIFTYQPTLSLPLGDGKVETRPVAEGGVRIITDYQTLPVETKFIPEAELTPETAAPLLVDEDQKQKAVAEILSRIGKSGLKLQTVSDSQPSSAGGSWIPPTADNTTGILRV